MKLWMVTNTGHVDYDEFDSFVVRAATAEEAQELAAESVCEDAYDYLKAAFWRTSPLVTVTELTADGGAGDHPRLVQRGMKVA
jgi:hypothetical protein